MTTQTPAQKAGLKIGDVVIVGIGRKCPHDFNYGQTATFHRDDKTDKPEFIQDGRLQYLDLSEIHFKPKTKTPAQKAGIEVGDTVQLLSADHIRHFGTEFVKLTTDDETDMPRFGLADKKQWIQLEYVRKVASGPKAGVLWSQAPVGATHYSMNNDHGQKWHKLNESGVWSYAVNGLDKNTAFIDYTDVHYAKVATQVAIPGVVVKVNPVPALFERVQELEGETRTKLGTVQTLNAAVAQLNVEKQQLIGKIQEAGYRIEGGKLVEQVPTYKIGDVVQSLVTGMDITKGRRYVLVDVMDTHVVFNDNTQYRRTRPKSEVKLVTSAPTPVAAISLQSVPSTQWREGDTIRNVSDRDVSYGDLTIGADYEVIGVVGASAAHVQIIDNAGDRRMRDSSEYVLVKRG